MNTLAEFSCKSINMDYIHEHYNFPKKTHYVKAYDFSAQHNECVVKMQIGAVSFMGAVDAKYMNILGDNECFLCNGGFEYYIDAGRCACDIVHYCKDECSKFQNVDYTIAAIGKFECNMMGEFQDLCDCVEDILHFAQNLNNSIIITADAEHEELLSEVFQNTIFFNNIEKILYQEDENSMPIVVYTLNQFVFPTVNGTELHRTPSVIFRTDYDYNYGESDETGE